MTRDDGFGLTDQQELWRDAQDAREQARVAQSNARKAVANSRRILRQVEEDQAHAAAARDAARADNVGRDIAAAREELGRGRQR
jgi:hypothetical protein